MQGTPFIYQGQELGMTNVHYQSIEDYNDVATKNLYKYRLDQGDSHEQVMELIWSTSRDNSRTPMQWSADENAGFTNGTPWIGVNPNYTEINVEKQEKDPNSILNYYKKMIQLRRIEKIFTYGIYDLVLEDHPSLYAYTRTSWKEKVIVLCNLSEQSIKVEEVQDVIYKKTNLLLSNLEVNDHEAIATLQLAPYEARVYKI
jgi:alpha-glucosidase